MDEDPVKMRQTYVFGSWILCNLCLGREEKQPNLKNYSPTVTIYLNT